ncbi:hypothetical protein WDU94_013113 [Cyamophila willieti]
MSGNMMERIESDSEDEVFMGPITKRELLAPIKNKVQKSHPKAHPVQVSNPRVIDSINLVTPAKSSAHNKPLDLSIKKSDPVVVDLSSPTVCNTILVSDTPGNRANKSSMFNISDFLDESEMGISVDSILVDLNRDIEAEMDNDMQELENKKFIQNQSVTSTGIASPNQSLHVQSFFNNTKHNETAMEGVVPNGNEKLNGTLPYNDERQVLNGDQTGETKHNSTIANTDVSRILANQSMNVSQASHVLTNQTMNASHIPNGTSVGTTQRNTTRTSLNGTTNETNISRNKSQNGLGNTSRNLTQSFSMNESELSNVLDTTEETSMMSSRELSTEDSNPHQDVLSDSFQYYTGEELNKENDLNQSNHLVQKNSPVSVKNEADLNETFENLSMNHFKSGSIHHAVLPNPAEDTLEEIDILETYGYTVKDKLSIPTINILSATIIEEEDVPVAERKSNNFSESMNKLPNTTELEKSIKEPSVILNHLLAQENLEELMNKSVCEESNEKNNLMSNVETTLEEFNKESNMSVVDIEHQVSMINQNMSVVNIPDLDKSSIKQEAESVNNQSPVVDQEESNVKDISQMLANTSIQAKSNDNVLLKTTNLYEEEDSMSMETSKLGEDPPILEIFQLNKSAVKVDPSSFNKSAVNIESSKFNKSAVNVDSSRFKKSSINVDSSRFNKSAVSVPTESVVCESLSAVDVIGMDSCVGLCETVNDIQEESIVSPPPCLDFIDEPDDLNRSIIDATNSDATNHWKEVNSAQNTYLDLSPIKKNASGDTDGFDFSTAATLGSDHTYAHGEPCSSQFSHMITRSEQSSSNSEDEIVQDVMFINMSNKKLLSIREEKEEEDGNEKKGDERGLEESKQERDDNDSEKGEIVVQEVVDVGIEDEDMEELDECVENTEDILEKQGLNEPAESVFVETQGENLNATFAEQNEAEHHVSEVQEETSIYERAIKDNGNIDTLEKSMAEVDITKDWKETSLEGDVKETNISKNGPPIGGNKEIDILKITSTTENVIEKADVTNAENTLPIEKSLLAESLKKANEQMQELNAELNENQRDITEKMDQDLSVHDISVAKNVTEVMNKLMPDSSHEEANMNKTLEKNITLEGNIENINEVTHQSVDERKEAKSEVIANCVDESIQPSVHEMSMITGTVGDKTQKTDHCNNTHLANKVIDECDFKAVVQKYEETTGASLSITNSELSFAPEFSKPRQINDDLNTSSPDLESSRKDTKKSTIKPSQIPMCRRPNVLRPTKFTGGDSIKLPTKPLAKIKTKETPTINGTSNTNQRDPQSKKPDSKTTTPTPVTPRSISRTLMSSFSSLANRITGRTPRKDVTAATPKLKSPEPSKPNAIKSPKPMTAGLKAAKPTGSTSGIKSPNLKPSSAADRAFSPIMARFRNVPSSTPAVKNISKTPTPRLKTNKTPGNDDTMGKQIRKSLSASKIEGQQKTLNKSSGFDSSLNNRKLDFKNIESKIGSIRKPDEIPALQKALKSPNTTATKPSLIKPPKFTSSKLPSLAPTLLPTKRPSKFLNVQSPIGAYIRDGTKATQESKRGDSSFIPRKLQKLNSAEGQSSTAKPGVKVVEENNKKEGNPVPASADVSMTDAPVIPLQEMSTSNEHEIQHTAL